MRRVVFFIGLLSLLVVAGCGRKAAPSRTSATETKSKDSVRVEYRDREVPVPGEKVVVTQVIECDSVTNKPKPATIEGRSGRAFTRTEVDANGNVTSTGGCDSTNLLLKNAEKEINRWKEKYEIERTTETKIEYKTRDIDIFCRYFSLLSAVLIVAVFVIRNR